MEVTGITSGSEQSTARVRACPELFPSAVGTSNVPDTGCSIHLGLGGWKMADCDDHVVRAESTFLSLWTPEILALLLLV